jgi:predicted site-specific integrase-resolvase
MRSNKVLKLLKITRQTLTRYVKESKIQVKKLPNGYYEYNDEDIYKLLGQTTPRKAVIYCRVSTAKQKQDLQNQESLSILCKQRHRDWG